MSPLVKALQSASTALTPGDRGNKSGRGRTRAPDRDLRFESVESIESVARKSPPSFFYAISRYIQPVSSVSELLGDFWPFLTSCGIFLEVQYV